MSDDVPLVCCDETTSWDETTVGTTCGGLEMIGAYVCRLCGQAYVGKASRPTDPNESERWKVSKGGRSIDIGSVRLRAEVRGNDDTDVPALMARIARLPELERALRSIAAGVRDPAAEARRALAAEDEPEPPITAFDGLFRFLSNFYPATTMFCGTFYPTAEHAYQAAKTFDPGERARICRARSAAAAKRMGRGVKLRENWDELKDDIMEIVVLDKFTRNPELAMALKATGNRELIEGNTWGDTYWGVCRGQGLNKLGQILMRVRHFLTAGERL